MKLQLLRHATMIIDIAGKKLLVDPMLSEKGEMDPVKLLTDFRRNPTVELPVGKEYIEDTLEKVDGVVVTHTHRDHFDSTAAKLIPKNKPLICQPVDEVKLKEMGFESVFPVTEKLTWNGIDFYRTNGHHGKGKVEEELGIVSGFVLKTENEPILYVAGDTVYCEEVEDAMKVHKPEVTVVNGGAASLIYGGPITMTAQDIEKFCRDFKKTRVVVVHMEAFNHCKLTREKLNKHLINAMLESRALIPSDGEILQF